MFRNPKLTGALKTAMSNAAARQPQIKYAPSKGRMPLPSPQGQKVPASNPRRQIHPVMQEADQDMSSTGDALRNVVSRLASGRGRMMRHAKGGKVGIFKKLGPLEKHLEQKRLAKERAQRKQVKEDNLEADEDDPGYPDMVKYLNRPISDKKPLKKAEGGKVSSGMGALRALAKKFEAALDAGDTETSERIKRQMERLQPGSSKKIGSQSESSKEKIATFAKGGKVESVAKGISAQRDRIRRLKDILSRDFRKAAKMKDDEPVRVRFGKGEDTHVTARGKKYSVQAGSDDDRYEFRSKDGEHVPVEFSDDLLNIDGDWDAKNQRWKTK